MTAGGTRTADVPRRQAQIGELQGLDLLRPVPVAELRLLAEHATFRALEPGALLTLDGRAGESCSFILSGTLWATLLDKHGQETLLGNLGRGDCFGEGGIFGLRERRAMVRAETICYLVQVPIDLLRSLLPQLPQLATELRRYYRRWLVRTTLSRVPIFSRLSPAVRQSVAERLQRVQVDRGTEIVREGQPGDALYLIELGQVVVEQDGAVIAHLSEGDFFGEISLLQARLHNATVRALTPGHLLMLPGSDFGRLLLDQPELRQEVEEVAAARIEAAAALRSDDERAARFEVVVSKGLLRGDHLLVREPALCPAGCRICEQACAERFGQPRLHLGGVALGEIDVLSACRQCLVGAECAEACPHDALTWDEHGALVVNDRCDGCGDCVQACPYDAVQLVSRRPAAAGSLIVRLAQRLQPRRPELAVPLVADKCDLCSGFEEMVCLSQCPTGSLRLVAAEDLPGLADHRR